MQKRPLILDVDGCVLDFEYTYTPVLKNEGIDLNENDFKQWDTLKSRGYDRKQVYRLVVKAWESDLFEDLPYIKGAKNFLEWAVTKFHIVYNTTVPETYREKRITNLNKLGILDRIGAEVRFATSHRDKSRIIGEYKNPIAFIDDKPKNVSAVKEDWPNLLSIWYNHKGLMNVYDYDPEPDYEAHSWSKVKTLLRKRNGR
jgi:hypothetical protein